MEGEGTDDIVCAWNGGICLSVLTFMARLLSLRERERERVVPYWGPVVIEGHVLLELLLLESKSPML